MTDSTCESRELTHAQMLLWTGQQMQPDDPLYNMALVFRIRGAIDVDAFCTAFQHLVERCDAMRMTIVETDGAPRQYFSEHDTSRLEVLDFTSTPDADAALREWTEERVRRRFNLNRCLYDSVLIQLAPEEFAWYLNQHHLITDAWSMAVIFKRVAQYYASARGDLADALLEPPQFRDFIARERSPQQLDSLDKARAFWRQKVEARVPASRLYGPVTRSLSGRTVRVRCRLGMERSKQIRQIAKRAPFRGFTADLAGFRFFSTILLACLYRLGGQQQLSLGAPSHNRGSAALKQTAGMFIELFPLRVEAQEGESLRSLAEKVAVESNQLLIHAIPAAMGFEHRGAFDVVLNYITASFGTFDGNPVESEWVHPGCGDREHRLRLQVQDFDRTAEFSLHFDISEDCASPAQRDRLVESFVRLVDAFIDDPERPLNTIALLSDEAAAQQRAAVRSPAAPLPQETIVEQFARQVAQWPKRIALCDDERRVSYEELDRASNRVAATLHARGAGDGSIIAIILPRSIEAVIAILGVLKAGAAYMPIELDHPRERIRYLIENSGARMALCTPHSKRLVDPDMVIAVDINDATTAELVEPSYETPSLDDTAYLIYTSGSTGRPKGVVVGHRSLANYIAWSAREYAAGECLDFALFSPLSFDLTVTSLFVPLITGGTLVVYPSAEGRRELTIRNVITDNRVDVVKLTPVHLRLIHDMDFSASRIRTLIVGGEDFPVDLAQSIHRRFGGKITIYNEYGPTEGTVACMIHRYDPDCDLGSSVPIGRAISNLEVHILDSAANMLPPGVIGELCIGGAGVACGYHQMEQTSAERFVDNPFRDGEKMFRSGDLAEWDENGVLHYCGRADNQVKIRGVRIETAEVESVLQTHPAIAQCVVDVFEDTAHSDAAVGSCRQCGLEASHPDANLDEESICRLCRDFESQRASIATYFGDPRELHAIVERIKREATTEHHCLMLLSGGKDSTYALCQIVEMGLNPLVFSLDNGFISEGAKANIRRVCDKFGLELVVGSPPSMNEIFVDSLNRFSNVCNGCFKTIYTLSMKLAHERGLRTIITGLSRGQIFDTRLAGLRQHQISDRSSVDRTIIEARKAYHRMDDAVSRCLDVSLFDDDRIFEEIEFVDFYRYSDANLEQMLDYLANEAPWVRPADTGRSTNCLINEAGIHVHKSERGFHNYALPYSWDVRLGHKQRDAAAAELLDEIDVARVSDILNEIGYRPTESSMRNNAHRRLAAWYVARTPVTEQELRAWLVSKVPAEYVPSSFVVMDSLPLTPNDKIDRAALPPPVGVGEIAKQEYEAPASMIEIALAEIWSDVLGNGRVGTNDNFFDLGGDSILNIQIVSRARDRGIVITPQQVFDWPTVGDLAKLAQTSAARVHSQEPIQGKVPLTPIQRRFFDEFRGERSSFSQVALFDLRVALERVQLEGALALLVEQHDTLRSRFEHGGDGEWAQVIEPADAVHVDLEVADFTALDDLQEADALERLTTALGQQLDIEAGKCVVATHVRRGRGRHEQLLVVIHHLVVDGVSWWIMSRDLDNALRSIAAGQTPELTARSSSWRQWAEALVKHAESPALRDEIPYWTRTLPTAVRLLDAANVPGARSETLRIELDRERTRRLLHEAPAALRAQVPDVLVAALLEAIGEETGGDTLRIDIEAHGREQLVEDLELLRTVGWFTSISPITLQRDGSGDPFATLRGVKERLRSVPNRGIGHGLLRYAGFDTATADTLEAQPKSQILFNYMGQWDRASDAQAAISLARPISLINEGDGQWLSPLGIDAVVFDTMLAVNFRFPADELNTATIRSLATRFLAALETLVDGCETADEAALAPSDFPHAGINQSELEDLLSDLGAGD